MLGTNGRLVAAQRGSNRYSKNVQIKFKSLIFISAVRYRCHSSVARKFPVVRYRKARRLIKVRCNLLFGKLLVYNIRSSNYGGNGESSLVDVGQLSAQISCADDWHAQLFKSSQFLHSSCTKHLIYVINTNLTSNWHRIKYCSVGRGNLSFPGTSIYSRRQMRDKLFEVSILPVRTRFT